MKNYSPLIQEKYAQIGSNELGYIDDALGCVMQVLSDISNNPIVPEEIRHKAAYAAANLLMSDIDIN